MPKEINKSFSCLSKTKFFVGSFDKYIGSEVKNKGTLFGEEKNQGPRRQKA